MKKSIICAVIAGIILGCIACFSPIANGQEWKPNPKFVTAKKDKVASQQCYGTTKKNERCKMKGQPGKDGKYYCRFHENQR